MGEFKKLFELYLQKLVEQKHPEYKDKPIFEFDEEKESFTEKLIKERGFQDYDGIMYLTVTKEEAEKIFDDFVPSSERDYFHEYLRVHGAIILGSIVTGLPYNLKLNLRAKE